MLALFLVALVRADNDQCCYAKDCVCGQTCTSCQGGWCAQSKNNCEGNCSGHFCPGSPTPKPVPGPGDKALTFTVDNPYDGAELFVNPHYQAEVAQSAKLHPSDAALVNGVKNEAAFIWLDNMAVVTNNLTDYMDEVSKQSQDSSGPVAIQLVVYDLPNRDCDAGASNGEILCEDSACAAGLETYRTKYIDPIVSILKKYMFQENLRVIIILEPDSLPNLATNLAAPKCAQSQTAYKTGTAYAIKQLSTVKNIYIYMDAAHGGWLGWPNNMEKAAPIYKEVVKLAGASGQGTRLRGFASNTANYQPLGSMSNNADPCKLSSQGNPCIDEVHYMSGFSEVLVKTGFRNFGWVTDTSRNGVTDMRKDCSNWCNINHSGLGRRPSSSPDDLGFDVDALVWAKTPGESDGTSDSSAKRFDPKCRSVDSYEPSPQAGLWNDPFFIMLCENAKPPIASLELNTTSRISFE